MKRTGRVSDLLGRCAVAKKLLEDEGFTVTFGGYFEFGFDLCVAETIPDFQKSADRILAAWPDDVADAREGIIDTKRTLVVRFRETK